MVYLNEIIKKYKDELLANGLVPAICYQYINDKEHLPKNIEPELGDEETLAIKGYLEIKTTEEEVAVIIRRKPIKQIDYTKNIYKLLGIYLAAGDVIKEIIDTKFESSSLKYKYLISKVLPDYSKRLGIIINQSTISDTPYFEILTFIFGINECDELPEIVNKLISQDLDIIDLILLEDLQRCLISRSISTKYMDLSSLEILKMVITEFPNAVKKITRERRKGHPNFVINDEYDVQDLLYIMLKPIFPTLLVEDPTPKVGPNFTKIDLIIREEEIILEVKMIKPSDKDEKPFITQLKDDIQSYYLYPYLKELIVFVYDPQNKTGDRQNFYSLNGIQEIKGVRFNIDVIVGV